MARFVCCTWNVENLFVLPTGRGALYRTKLDYLAGEIEALGRDVIALQEIGSPEALLDLKARCLSYRHAVASSHPDRRGIRVAFLSRLRASWTGELVLFPDGALLRLRADTGPRAVTSEMLIGPTERSIARPDKLDDVRLYNLADQIPEARRYSWIHNKRPELIDQILVTRRMIFELERADADVGPINPIGDDPRVRRDEVVPDHAPVSARFAF